MNSLSTYGTKQKILLSLLFGIISLMLSPYGFKVVSGEIALNIPWSIIFPILISLAFGWKYALIAGLSGGAYFPILLWPNDGLANLTTAFFYLLFFVIIGLIFDSKYFRKIHKITVR